MLFITLVPEERNMVSSFSSKNTEDQKRKRQKEKRRMKKKIKWRDKTTKRLNEDMKDGNEGDEKVCKWKMSIKQKNRKNIKMAETVGDEATDEDTDRLSSYSTPCTPRSHKLTKQKHIILIGKLS